MKKSRKARWLVVLAVLIGVLINVAILAKEFEPATMDSIRAIDKNLIIVLLLLLLLSWLIEGLRLRWISSKLKINLTLKQSIQLHLISMFGAFSTPMGSGELPMFMYYGVRKQKNLEDLGAFAIIRIIFTKMAFLTFIILNFVIYRGSRDWGTVGEGAFYLVSAILIITLSFYLFLIYNYEFCKKIMNKCRFIPEKIRQKDIMVTPQIKETLKQPLIPYLLTMSYWIIFFTPAIILSLRFNMNIHPVSLLLKQVIVYLTIPLSPIPGGAGVVELLYYGIFAGVLPPSQLAVFILIVRMINFYIPLLMGAIVAIKQAN